MSISLIESKEVKKLSKLLNTNMQNYDLLSNFCHRGSVAERSKALVLGTSQKWRGFESHLCQELFRFYFLKLLRQLLPADGFV